MDCGADGTAKVLHGNSKITEFYWPKNCIFSLSPITHWYGNTLVVTTKIYWVSVLGLSCCSCRYCHQLHLLHPLLLHLPLATKSPWISLATVKPRYDLSFSIWVFLYILRLISYAMLTFSSQSFSLQPPLRTTSPTFSSGKPAADNNPSLSLSSCSTRTKVSGLLINISMLSLKQTGDDFFFFGGFEAYYLLCLDVLLWLLWCGSKVCPILFCSRKQF